MAIYLGTEIIDARIGGANGGSSTEYSAGNGIIINSSTKEISIDENIVATKEYIDSIFDEINDTLDQILG